MGELTITSLLNNKSIKSIKSIKNELKYLTSEDIKKICKLYQLPYKFLINNKTYEEFYIYLSYVIKYSPISTKEYDEIILTDSVKNFINRNKNYEDLIPKHKYPIDFVKADMWINSQCTLYTQKAARFFLEHTKYVDFNTFFYNLRICNNHFINTIKDKNYILLTLYNPFKGIKSSYWLSHLIYPLLHPKPVDVLPTIENSNVITDYLILDDAMYSGVQMYHNLYHIFSVLEKHNNITIHIVVPYYTNQSIICLDEFTDEITKIGSNITIKIYKLILMKTLQEYLDEDEDNIDIIRIKEIYTSIFNIKLDNVPLYFDHKLPDLISSYPKMYNGILPNLIKLLSYDKISSYVNFINKTSHSDFFYKKYVYNLDHCIDNSKFSFIPYISNCQEIDIENIKSQKNININYCPPAFYKKIFPYIKIYYY